MALAMYLLEKGATDSSKNAFGLEASQGLSPKKVVDPDFREALKTTREQGSKTSREYGSRTSRQESLVQPVLQTSSWQEAFDDAGNLYYYHWESNRSSWDAPAEGFWDKEGVHYYVYNHAAGMWQAQVQPQELARNQTQASGMHGGADCGHGDSDPAQHSVAEAAFRALTARGTGIDEQDVDHRGRPALTARNPLFQTEEEENESILGDNDDSDECDPTEVAERSAKGAADEAAAESSAAGEGVTATKKAVEEEESGRGPGKLARIIEEEQAAVAEGEELSARGCEPALRREMSALKFDEVDTNGDGQIDRSEWDAAVEGKAAPEAAATLPLVSAPPPPPTAPPPPPQSTAPPPPTAAAPPPSSTAPPPPPPRVSSDAIAALAEAAAAAQAAAKVAVEAATTTQVPTIVPNLNLKSPALRPPPPPPGNAVSANVAKGKAPPIDKDIEPRVEEVEEEWSASDDESVDVPAVPNLNFGFNGD